MLRMDIFWRYIGSTELVVFCFTVFCAVILHGLIGPLFYWWKRGIPSIKGIPLFGSMLNSLLQKRFLGDLYMDMYIKLEGKRYGGFLKFTKPAIILRDPELIKIVLERAFPSFHDNDLALNEDIEPMFGRNLFVVTGERWKQLRTHLSPAFTSGRIRAVYPLVQEVCDNLHTYLDGVAGTEIEMKDLCARFTTEVVSSCAFGIHSDAICYPNSEFRVMALEMLNPSPIRATVVTLLLQFPWILRFFPVSLLPDNVTNFFRRLVREVATHREREGVKRNDFMDLLLQLKKEGKLGIKLEEGTPEVVVDDSKENSKGKVVPITWDPESIDDVAAQAVGFFVDGSETSATLMSFAFFELAQHPEIQEKLRDEIKDAKLRYGGNLSYDALQEITYLEMVLLETLRKYPPASFMARLTTKPYKLPNPEYKIEGDNEGGLLLKIDTPVVIPVLAIHRDPKYYPDPDTFDPERFSEDVRHKRDRFTFLPFGEGPRICIGKRFGLMQSKAAIASTLLSFELMPSSQTLPPITFDPSQFLAVSKNQLWVYVKRLKTLDD